MKVKDIGMYLTRQQELKWLKIFSHKVSILVPAEATGGVFSVIEQQSPPGEGIPQHIHNNEDETFVLLDGDMDLEFDGQKIKVRKGDTFFLPRGKAHGYINNGSAVCRVLVIINPGGFEKFFEEVQSIDSGNPSNLPQIAELLEKKYATRFLGK